MDMDRVNLTLEAAYREKTPGSERLAEEARALFPSGITHDGRHLTPHGIYVERAAGPHKWDVDGNRYIDFYGGHGALILGHAHPAVTEAARQALAAGTHFAAGHAHEIRWARQIQALMPSAERVRFTSSGTEASLMAVRLVRAFTGKPKILRFRTHFHGWHDHLMTGWTSHYDGTPTTGVLPGIAGASVLVDPNDIDGVRAALAGDPEIAAVILEPTGASFGMVPTRDGFLHDLREVTAEHGVLLVFDEVVTGFRVAPGGAQEVYGIRPDVTLLAKIVAGGLPGGAVAGRAQILDLIDFARTAERGVEKVQHPGTFNANPVSAAAGAAALRVVADDNPCAVANALAERLRDGLNAVLAAEDVPWVAYGSFSGVHLFTNAEGRAVDAETFDPLAIPFMELKKRQDGLAHRVRIAMLLGGVDFSGWPGGLLSGVHTESDVADTTEAFRDAIRLLKREGDVATRA